MPAASRSGLGLRIEAEHFPFHQPFRISSHVFESTAVVVVRLNDDRHEGWGEGAGAYYLGDDLAKMLAEAEKARAAIEGGISREELQHLMPPGGARNAVDCAYWDLEAKRTGQPVWQLAGLEEPHPLLSTMTLGADNPEAMAGAACKLDPAAPVKVKLTGEVALDIERLRAIRVARPQAWLGVDANQGYSLDTLRELIPVLSECSVALLEQPLPRGSEALLEDFDCPIRLAADESALTLADTDGLEGRFDIVNIKLDKCGGLTEALAIARRAKELGLGVMVGNMMGSSLSMAPSFLVGQLCDVVDLDGPTFLAKDRSPSVEYRGGRIHCDETIWGHPQRYPN